MVKKDKKSKAKTKAEESTDFGVAEREEVAAGSEETGPLVPAPFPEPEPQPRKAKPKSGHFLSVSQTASGFRFEVSDSLMADAETRTKVEHLLASCAALFSRTSAGSPSRREIDVKTEGPVNKAGLFDALRRG